MRIASQTNNQRKATESCIFYSVEYFQMVLERISWLPETMDSDEEQDCSLESRCLFCGYLKRLIENCMFWGLEDSNLEDLRCVLINASPLNLKPLQTNSMTLWNFGLAGKSSQESWMLQLSGKHCQQQQLALKNWRYQDTTVTIKRLSKIYYRA